MSNWISHKAQYFKKNGDIDRKKECTCFLLDTINSDLYEVQRVLCCSCTNKNIQ